jgi:transposase
VEAALRNAQLGPEVRLRIKLCRHFTAITGVDFGDGAEFIMSIDDPSRFGDRATSQSILGKRRNGLSPAHRSTFRAISARLETLRRSPL